MTDGRERPCEPGPDTGIEPRDTDDDRPVDVAPRTGPVEMDAPEAGMPDERDA